MPWKRRVGHEEAPQKRSRRSARSTVAYAEQIEDGGRRTETQEAGGAPRLSQCMEVTHDPELGAGDGGGAGGHEQALLIALHTRRVCLSASVHTVLYTHLCCAECMCENAAAVVNTK